MCTLPKNLIEDCKQFIELSQERDRLNEEENYGEAFEIECCQRDLGEFICNWLLTNSEEE